VNRVCACSLKGLNCAGEVIGRDYHMVVKKEDVLAVSRLTAPLLAR
jgi:hypothetical protein